MLLYFLSPICASNTGARTVTPSTTTVISLFAAVALPFLLFHKLLPETLPLPKPVAVVSPSIVKLIPAVNEESISIAALPSTAVEALNVQAVTVTLLKILADSA